MNEFIVLNSDNTKVQMMSFMEGIFIDDHIKKKVMEMYEASGKKTETYTVYRLGRKTVDYVIDRETITAVKETIL